MKSIKTRFSILPKRKHIVARNKRLIMGLVLAIFIPAIFFGSAVLSGYQKAKTNTLTSSGTSPTTIQEKKVKDKVIPEQASTASPPPHSSQIPPPSGAGDYNVTETCKDIVIPFETIYYDNSEMYVGETKIYSAGKNGIKKDCTEVYDGKDWGMYLGKVHKYSYTKIYTVAEYMDRGTKPISTSPSYSQEQAMQLAKNKCSGVAQAGGTSSSAYQNCITTALRSYGH